VVEQLKSMPNLPNECSIENYTQLAKLGNIKVKQEFELIMLDTEVIHVNIFTCEPIKIMVQLIKKNNESTVINKRPI